MSRIGRQPITIPEKVTVTLTGSHLVVKSDKAELSASLPKEIKVEVKDNQVLVSIAKNQKTTALHGLWRSLINNLIVGVTEGFVKKLELVGTGFRANLKDPSTGSGQALEMSLGFSHPVVFVAPEGISFAVEEQKTITVTGADKYLVGQVAANLRKLRLPDPYKGKGIRYLGEVVKLKPGKAVKAAGTP